ncbi:MAG: GNAT family N-acetyltransferase [Proteobacteria bacterium]|nr:GNAT family N-acetyltransferase [Pseudomonadota bacterium]
MTQRPARESDGAFLRQLYEDVRARDIAAWGPMAETLVPMQLRAQEGSYRAQFPDADHRIIECDGVAVGRCIVWRSAHEIRVVDVALLAAHRGRGLGTAVLTPLCDEARQTGRPLRLHVDAMNEAARRLYERLGLRVTELVGVQWAMSLDPVTQASPTLSP